MPSNILEQRRCAFYPDIMCNSNCVAYTKSVRRMDAVPQQEFDGKGNWLWTYPNEPIPVIWCGRGSFEIYRDERKAQEKESEKE